MNKKNIILTGIMALSAWTDLGFTEKSVIESEINKLL